MENSNAKKIIKSYLFIEILPKVLDSTKKQGQPTFANSEAKFYLSLKDEVLYLISLSLKQTKSVNFNFST